MCVVCIPICVKRIQKLFLINNQTNLQLTKVHQAVQNTNPKKANLTPTPGGGKARGQPDSLGPLQFQHHKAHVVATTRPTTSTTPSTTPSTTTSTTTRTCWGLGPRPARRPPASPRTQSRSHGRCRPGGGLGGMVVVVRRVIVARVTLDTMVTMGRC